MASRFSLRKRSVILVTGFQAGELDPFADPLRQLIQRATLAYVRFFGIIHSFF
jgi:hypothetical protein